MPLSFASRLIRGLLATGCVLGLAGSALAQDIDTPYCTTTGSYQVCTDQQDYAPGQTVYIAGSGFAANASLTVRVTKPDLTTDSDPVTTDSSGAFFHGYALNGQQGTYVIDVLSGSTVLASHTFTDANHVDCTADGGTNQGSDCTLPFVAIAGGASPASKTFTYYSSTSTNDSGVLTVDDGGAGWLGAVPSSFSFTNPGSATFTVSVDSSGLAAGIYTGTITVDPDDASANNTVTVTLWVETPNPELGASCGTDIVLVMDGSGSVDATEYAQMQAAFVDFVQAFLVDAVTPTEFAIVELATNAVVRLNFTGDAQAVIDEINAPRVQPGGQYTNWDDGLAKARALFPNRANPDLIVFSSDGNPNRRGGHTTLGHSATVQSVSTADAMAWAIEEANAAKSSGTRMVAIGIGDQLDVTNLEAISSADAVITSNFDQLAADLASLANDLCGGSVTVHKVIDLDGNLATTGDQGDGAAWTFSTTVDAPDSATPPSGNTDGSGLINFDLDVGTDGTANLDVTETLKPGYTFLSAACTKQGGGAVGTPASLAVNDITVSSNDTVSCTFYNQAPDCSYLDDQCNVGVFDFGSGSCQAQPVSGSCDDGNACTTGEQCSAGACVGGTPVTCNDGNACTTDTCNPSSGCVYTNNTNPCDDGDACTTGDQCSGGSCGGTPVTCNDGNVCTTDTCNSATGCVYTNNTDPCSDGDACTTGEQCSAGSCVGGTPVTCNDGNGCTDDSCNSATGCVYTNNTAACDDGSLCTTGDQCSGGSCTGGTPVTCDDGNVCTTDSCNPSTGNCSFTNNTDPCSDGDACTTGEQCSGGSCTGGAPVTCNDGNVCTNDSCNSATGCVYTNNTDPCSDGDACTTGEQCSGGSCTGGAPVTCNDGNVCTDDSCNSATGCVYTNNTDPCSDGDACTTGEQCSGGSCTGGAPVTCNDGNVCTDDSCNSATGCVYTNNTDPCSDGDACTTGEQCSGGSCTGGAPVTCNDGNVCTDDSCNSATGCVYTNNTDPCSDGDACTTGEQCSGGSCTGGALVTCNDGDVCTADTCDSQLGCMSSDICCGNGVVDRRCSHDPLVFCTTNSDCSQLMPGSTCTEGEQCDPAISSACDAQCQIIATCGDGIVGGGEECDDGGESATCDADCTLAVCGDGTTNTTAGEQCDPQQTGICDASCQFAPVCGDGIVGPGEECDDFNVVAGDGCGATCQLEEKFCFVGEDPGVAGKAKRLAFSSTASYCLGGDSAEVFCASNADCGTGGVCANTDGNREIFFFDRKKFLKAVKKGADNAVALKAALSQITDTVAPVSNETPTVNRTARIIGAVSTGDLTGQGTNLDGNREIFYIDRKKGTVEQITDSSGYDNLHPNMRATRANLLVFDSAANLVPDRCAIAGEGEVVACTTNADCAGGFCGNPENNREVFTWVRSANPSESLRQVTAAPSGASVVGQSVNFNSRSTALTSTANLLPNTCVGGSNVLGTCTSNGDCGGGVCGNPDGNAEIFRVARRSGVLVPITGVGASGGDSFSPSQAKAKIVVFASNGDHAGQNADGNDEIFVWRETETPAFLQITDTVGCSNDAPAIDNRGRFVAFQSDCDLLGPNPDQSVFVYDLHKDKLLDFLVLRGPGDSASGSPQVVERARSIVFAGNVGSANPAICIFDAKKKQLEGPLVTPP